MNSLLAGSARYVRGPLSGRCRKSPARASAGRKRLRARLNLEPLEDRTVPSYLAFTSLLAPKSVSYSFSGISSYPDPLTGQRYPVSGSDSASLGTLGMFEGSGQIGLPFNPLGV